MITAPFSLAFQEKAAKPEGRVGRSLFANVRKKIVLKQQKDLVALFATEDSYSLVKGAETRMQKREMQMSKWHENGRTGMIPVPPPPELPDDGTHSKAGHIFKRGSKPKDIAEFKQECPISSFISSALSNADHISFTVLCWPLLH